MVGLGRSLAGNRRQTILEIAMIIAAPEHVINCVLHGAPAAICCFVPKTGNRASARNRGVNAVRSHKTLPRTNCERRRVEIIVLI